MPASGEGSTQPGQVFEEVVGAAPVSVAFAEDFGEAVLVGPGVDRLHVVADPVSTGEDSRSHGLGPRTAPARGLPGGAPPRLKQAPVFAGSV